MWRAVGPICRGGVHAQLSSSIRSSDSVSEWPPLLLKLFIGVDADESWATDGEIVAFLLLLHHNLALVTEKFYHKFEKCFSKLSAVVMIKAVFCCWLTCLLNFHIQRT